jgi:hypothetical protein
MRPEMGVQSSLKGQKSAIFRQFFRHLFSTFFTVGAPAGGFDWKEI